MFKQTLRHLLLGVAYPLRPLLRLFCWWVPVRFAAFGDVVVLPDSMAVALVAFGGVWLLPLLGWSHLWSHIFIYCVALLLSPFMFLAVLGVNGNDVKVVRLFALVPYWVHRVPSKAKFELYEAWEDPAPTGVAFEASAYGADPLHLGTSLSAAPLFAYVGELLGRAGWKRTAFGYESPAAAANAT